MELRTKRFILRLLDPELDDFTRYLSWLKDRESNQFINGISPDWNLAKVVEYVKSKNAAEDSILFGIFTQIDNLHIGNIKLEPIVKESRAFLGILIGDVEWRRRKVGTEVISRVLDFAFEILKLDEIRLGVSDHNLAGYGLYLRLGFTEIAKIHSTNSNILAIESRTWYLSRNNFIDDIDK